MRCTTSRPVVAGGGVADLLGAQAGEGAGRQYAPRHAIATRLVRRLVLVSICTLLPGR